MNERHIADMDPFSRDFSKYAPSDNTYLTVGVFDGVHLGHKRLLNCLAAEAAANGCVPGVVTFLNHPREVLTPGFSVDWLATPEERIDLLHQAGMELVAPIRFTKEASRVRAADFVKLLQQHLGMRGLVVGPDFAMGHNREGTPEFLAALGQTSGFALKVAQLEESDGVPISSSLIRGALSRGDAGAASRLLGRNYAVSGDVVRGDGRGGSTLGFPTANIAVPPQKALPSDGIYAAMAFVEGTWFQAAASIGVRPTFGGSNRTVEAYLLDFNGDLYGKTTLLEFVQRLRDEAYFSSTEELRLQIEKDVEHTRQVLAGVFHETRL